MKTKIAILLFLLFGLTIKLKAQTVNYADSVKKYQELYHYMIAGSRLTDVQDSIMLYFFKRATYYKYKIDSVADAEQAKERLALKQRLETKYHIKLP